VIARLFKPRWVRILLAALLACTLLWIVWAESQPEQERWLRIQAQQRLSNWFPEAMQPVEGELGFYPPVSESSRSPLVIMVHGLDEPGGIFDELAAALDSAGYANTQFRYPNDQTIPHSADLLAEHWSSIPEDLKVVLIGHSMGGLLIRSFVTRAMNELAKDHAEVTAALLIGTPNQGSDWARLRVWLELRDRLGADEVDDFSLFAGLRDGTGAAKIDLRPGSQFLQNLNARPWPENIKLAILGGQIVAPASSQRSGMAALVEGTDDADWSARFGQWLDQNTAQLGDGAVSVDSLSIPDGPTPEIVEASHRGLLVSGPFSDQTPPGIPWALTKLAEIP